MVPSLNRSGVLGIFLIMIGSVFFQIPPLSGAEIPFVEWNRLSDRDVSPQGKAALAVNKDAWKHAETAHFVYHFTDGKEAETVYVHAEVYYQWVKEMFGVDEDGWSKKGHIFIFKDENDWRAFSRRSGENLPGMQAFTTGWELYMRRDPFWLKPQKTLAHEITHIILFRFLDGPIPLFLNEGFAEFMSTKAVAVQADGNEFNLRTIRLISEGDFIPLEKLISATSYPEKGIEIFYRESELLVRFLILSYDRKNFYLLMKDVSAGRVFPQSLKRIYGLGLADLEEKFRSFALAKNVSV